VAVHFATVTATQTPGTAALRAAGEPKPRFRGLSHLLAFASALTLAPLLIVETPGIAPRFIMAIYALSIVGLFGVSALYHRNEWSTGWVLFAIVWIGAAVGIAGRLFFTNAPYAVVAIPYVVVGWSSLFVINHIWALGVASFVLLVVGGALYSLGAIIYALHRPNPWPLHFGYHEIFHVLTIAGAACHYVVIAIFVRGMV